MADDSKVQALAAKERGNTFFVKKTREGYEQALVAYDEAIALEPENHVFYGNRSACYLALAEDSWEPRTKIEHYARGLLAARDCTTRAPTWVKGFVRQAQAEFELIAASAKWEERKKQDEKWQKEDAERAAKDRAEGREPFISERKEDPALPEELAAVVESASYAACEEACRRGLEAEAANAPLRTRLQSLRDLGHATDEAKDRAMRNVAAAAEAKAKGNTAFAAKRWKEAVDHYTAAMEQDPFDHVFFSNRSACYAEDDQFDKAIQDAERCINLNPQFAKGYSRHAHALFHLGRYVDMEAAAKAGLALDQSSTALQELLKTAQAETAEPLEVQRNMHQLRQEKRQEAKLQDLLKGLNMGGKGGPNIQMFNPGAGGDLSGLLGGLGGGGGGMGGFGGGSGKARMTEEQMRGMARAMASNPANGSSGASAAVPTASSAPAAVPTASAAADSGPTGPMSFAPKL